MFVDVARAAGFAPLARWADAGERRRITVAAVALIGVLAVHVAVAAVWGPAHPLLLRWCLYASALSAFHGLEFVWSARCGGVMGWGGMGGGRGRSW